MRFLKNLYYSFLGLIRGTSAHYQRVKEFHKKGNQPHSDKPRELSAKERELRAALILEEALETIEGLGIHVAIVGLRDATHYDVDTESTFELTPMDYYDPIEVIDGCADLIYVTTGTMVQMGIKDKGPQEEVDYSNLTKFRDGYSVRYDGKIIKSPLYEPANIKKELEQQGLK